MRLGLTIDNTDLYQWKRILVKDRNIGNPSKKKIMEHIPYSNTPLDFSELYGDQVFEERTIEYTLTLIPELRTRESSELLKTQLVNLLMNKTQFKLYDDIFPNYYFLAEVRDGPNFEKTMYLGELTVAFTAYPFRIDSLPEGNDIWDTFNFELDVAQRTKFNLSSLNPDIELYVGQYVTSNAETIWDENTGITRKIVDKRSAVVGVHHDYLLEHNPGWFSDYKIMEAYSQRHEVNLINPSIVSVSPEVITTGPTSIILNGRVYLFDESLDKNDSFMLKPGINNLEIITYQGIDIEFIFHKELI